MIHFPFPTCHKPFAVPDHLSRPPRPLQSLPRRPHDPQTPARLVDLAVRVGQLLDFQSYNIKSPLNAEAAMWTDLHAAELPIDA